jgi:hypothetical protein
MQPRFLFLLLAIFLFQCEKREVKKSPVLPQNGQSKVLILCEGNYTWNNASIDIYYPQINNLMDDIFAKQNNAKPLGDVLQSACKMGNELWLVLNNSAKIVAIGSDDFKYKKSIIGLKSPRYMVNYNAYFYITDLYANYIAVADTGNLNIVKRIYCKGWSEQILVANGVVWFANARGYLFEIDPALQTIKDSIQVPAGAKYLCLDKNNQIWALSSDSNKNYLCRLNPITKSKDLQISVPLKAECMRLALNKAKDTLYFIAGGLFAMAANAGSFSGAAVYQKSGENLYGLGIDPFNGDIYLANAKDYVSKGDIIVLTAAGKEKARFSSGIIPSGFLFYQ